MKYLFKKILDNVHLACLLQNEMHKSDIMVDIILPE